MVPVLKIGNEFVRDSAYIIERLDELTGSNSINLWPQETNKRDELRKWVYNTTIDENVKLGKSFGTTIPLFSTGLIEILVKKLKLRSILHIIFKHPRKERKIAFVAMYFFSIKNKIGPLAYDSFVNGLIEIDKHLDNKDFRLLQGYTKDLSPLPLNQELIYQNILLWNAYFYNHNML